MKCAAHLGLALLGLSFYPFYPTVAWGQQRAAPGGTADKSLIQRFDTNGDGKIDDQERRGVREKMRQMQNRPGAMTPSGKTETIGGRLVTEMQYPSSDGKMIPCVLSMPKGDGPFPVLVTIHGGQGNRDLGYIRTMAAPNNLSPTISAFNEQHWAILAISYRAGNGALFGMEQDDVVAGIRFAKGLPKVDPDRVGVVGGSHGGHLALVAAEKMGREFLCLAVGSPWMTDPVVYMTGDPSRPPLSEVPAEAREALMQNGRRIAAGMRRGRNLSEEEFAAFITKHSIEASADKIIVPTLFITSRGDDQAPHALIAPMIERMKRGGKEVQVYTAQKSPHGFYWARTVSAARDLRGEKTPQEAEEELNARRTMIEFFSRQFARTDAKTDVSPATAARFLDDPAAATAPFAQDASAQDASESAPSESGGSERRSARQVPGRRDAGGRPGVERGAAMGRGAATGRARGIGGGGGGGDFKSLADESGKITREAFKERSGVGSALASRPEIIDRIFDRLDTSGDGTLDQSEFGAMKGLREQFSPGANRRGAGGGDPQGTKELGGMPRDQQSPPSDTPQPTADTARPTADKADLSLDETGGKTSAATRRLAGGETTSVRVAAGELLGELVGGDSGSGVRVFRGVPYAAPPIGKLRWASPEPPIPWVGVRDATRFGTPALQGETFTPRSQQSEDCLFLNVWTPADATPDSKLPVLFWIHGGAFIQGSGAQPRYDGTRLARCGAVVITINYRLGPLGLFAHPALTEASDPETPLGNYCLLDMIAALRWTRDNIAAFGGDPGNVTISGSSAGGTSCLFLMGIAEAQPLFHKAIIHSSGGIKNIQTLEEAEAAGVRLAQRVGLGADATAKVLRETLAGDLAVGVGMIRELELPVKPMIDGRLVKVAPADLFAQRQQSKIPVLIGAANGESGARMLGDEVATGGAFGFQRQLADQMANSGQPVWMFQLTYVPPQSRDNRFAASHGETVAYAFGTIGQSIAAGFGFRDDRVAAKAIRSRRGGGFATAGGGREDDSREVEESPQGRKISDAMIGYWIAFMRVGDPNNDQLPPWPRHVAAAPRTMVFGNQSIVAK